MDHLIRFGRIFWLTVVISHSLNAVSLGQQPFSVSITPVAISGAPAIHSFAFASYNDKWLFIGGRTNGLHGFLPPFGFPSSGINDSAFVVDPVANKTWAASLSSLPVNIREAVTLSNMEYYQNDSMLYMVGGYGFKSSLNDFVTFSKLTAIDIKALMNAVTNGNNINSCFRQINNANLAVAGGEMKMIDSVYYLVFGHKFDGRYDRSDTTGFFTQEYSNQIRKFQIMDDGTNLSISNYSAITDTVNFHRRDYNLVPQIFPNGDYGLTAFSGVFQYGINLPYLTSVDISSSGYTVNSNFSQNLSQYSSAHMPVYDSINNVMHTLFFGGMSMYYIDSVTQLVATDSLVPFVNTISKVSRSGNGTLTETALNIKMPSLLGTNAVFIVKPSVKNTHGIIDLNALSGNTNVGYIIGGISSPDPNISETDPALSSASFTIFKVKINKNVTGVIEIPVSEPVSVSVTPNPFIDQVRFFISALNREVITIDIYDVTGKKVKNIFNSRIKGNTIYDWNASGYDAGIYYYEIKQRNFKKTGKLILSR